MKKECGKLDGDSRTYVRKSYNVKIEDMQDMTQKVKKMWKEVNDNVAKRKNKKKKKVLHADYI